VGLRHQRVAMVTAAPTMTAPLPRFTRRTARGEVNTPSVRGSQRVGREYGGSDGDDDQSQFGEAERCQGAKVYNRREEKTPAIVR